MSVIAEGEVGPELEQYVNGLLDQIKQLKAERDSAIRGQEIANNDLEVFQGILKRVEAERDALKAQAACNYEHRPHGFCSKCGWFGEPMDAGERQ